MKYTIFYTWQSCDVFLVYKFIKFCIKLNHASASLIFLWCFTYFILFNINNMIYNLQFNLLLCCLFITGQQLQN